jgi:hypothetical protein
MNDKEWETREWKTREVSDIKLINKETGEVVLYMNSLKETKFPITNLPSLANVQVSAIRTMWEIAQNRIDDIYSVEGAKIEKQAFERWMEIVFPFNYMDIIRA